MERNNFKKYQKYDWEAINYPLKTTDIISITNHYKVPFNATLEIFRDKNLKLKGKLSGIIIDINDLEYRENGVIIKNGFINGETLKVRGDQYTYLIKEFGLENLNVSPYNILESGDIEQKFNCDVYLSSVEILNDSNKNVNIISDFFLCSLPEILFSNLTKRFNETTQYKFRQNIDVINEENENIGFSSFSSWDYSILNFEEKKIIIQRVPKHYLPNNIDGILIEYRDISSDFPSDKFREMVQEYLSFIIGDHLQKVGTSEYTDNYELISSKSINMWKKDIQKQRNIHPIPLKRGAEREFFEKVINSLFANFIKIYQQYSISDCLWKLWIGKDLPLGTNLPIIASGLETLIDSYLKEEKILKKYTKKDKALYKKLINDELRALKEKLADYEFKESLINKLENPYNYSVGEKMRIFFKCTSFQFGSDSIENSALKARNLMVHQESNFESVEELRYVIKLSHAYITLVNRVILKLMGYDWYYIDYSKEGIRYLKMEENL